MSWTPLERSGAWVATKPRRFRSALALSQGMAEPSAVMKTAFKICCIQSEAEAEAAISAGASAIGLVGAMPSGPGPIDDAAIARISATAWGRALTVLLTSETTTDGVLDHWRRCRTGAVQLVDAVEAGTAAALRKTAADLVVIQVIHVQGKKDIAEAQKASRDADHLLLDSGAPQNEVKELGGTGRTHDWALSAKIVQSVNVPVWLAGGLNPSNVAEAIGTVRPHGVDVCSGLRPEGALDSGLLKAFASAVRT